jgi:general secretion pathway protein J
MQTRRRQCRNNEQGFTLLEMLVSVTLIAIMAVALWAVFRISINSWIRGTEFVDVNQRNRTVLDLVKKQIASIHGVMAQTDLQTGGITYPVFFGTESSMQFISLNSLRFQEHPGLTMVSYDLTADGHGGYSLVERESQYLGLDPLRASVFEDRNEPVTVIYENLMTFMFEYFDPGNVSRPPRWVKEWNPREIKEMPTAVSMTMISRDPKGGLLSRHMVVPIQSRPFDLRTLFVNPFENRPRRYSEDDPRATR